MKLKMSFSRKDVVVTLACLTFLLVVLGAVGATGRRRAKELLCLSNLRQWGGVWLAYAEDNDGYFMIGWSTEQPPGIPVYKHYWMEALRPYYVNPDLRCCPEATIPATLLGLNQFNINGGTFLAWGEFSGECGEQSTLWHFVVGCDYGSYGVNAWVHNTDIGPDINWRTPNVDGAENIPMFGGHQWLDAWPDEDDVPPDYDGQPWNQTRQMGRFCINRHSGFVNWAFLDGSARKVGLKELWTLKWHRNSDTCGPWTVCGGVEPNDWPVWMRDFEDY